MYFFQGIVRVTKHIGELKKLVTLRLNYNPQLESLSAEVGTLPLSGGLSKKRAPVFSYSRLISTI